ncbi:MAG TPA: MFS transporter [Burkholderiaceae bacterium]|nr:MFS transporter [Burkholderiaceae bacterium]
MRFSPLARARHATHAAFFVFGFVMAVFGVHVPSVRAHYGLDDGALAVALLGVAVGAVLCLALAGRLIGAFGARRVAAASATVMCAVLALLLQPVHYAALLALVVLLGAAVGLFDVAINTEGTYLEAALARKVMSLMHGLWSLGGMAGAMAGAWMLERGVAAPLQLAGVAAGALVVAWGACAGMLHTHAEGRDAAAAAPAGTGWRAMPRAARRTLVALGALAVLGLLAEGAIYDWSVLFLQRERGAAPALAALGFAAFSAAMALGRFGGDALRARVAAPRLLAASATVAGAAMVLVLTAGPVGVAIGALALVGLGLANVVPVLFVAASRVPGASPAAGIALVSSMGWIGIVIGPPLVGGVAQASSLGVGLAVIVVAAWALALAAHRALAGTD